MEKIKLEKILASMSCLYLSGVTPVKIIMNEDYCEICMSDLALIGENKKLMNKIFPHPWNVSIWDDEGTDRISFKAFIK